MNRPPRRRRRPPSGELTIYAKTMKENLVELHRVIAAEPDRPHYVSLMGEDLEVLPENHADFLVLLQEMIAKA